MLNDKEFRKCFRIVDPVVRSESSAVTEYQYENSLRQFIACYGCVRVLDVTLQLHVGELSVLYENRDFAVGNTTWADESGAEHMFQERWVRNGQHWYTRSTGLVTPTARPQRDNGKA
jgi:hypothetical protein